MYDDACGFAVDFFEFFRHQPKLERVWLHADIKLMIYDRPYLLLHILESLPDLKELQYNGFISAGRWAYLSCKEIHEFLKNTRYLEALALRDTHLSRIFPVSDLQELDPSLKFTRLKKLCLGPYIDDAIVLEILNRCSASLQFLELDLTVGREITKKIFEKHVSLLCLPTPIFHHFRPIMESILI